VKIARYAHSAGDGWGFIEDGTIMPARERAVMLAALADRTRMEADRAGAGSPMALEEVQLLAPIPDPPQFIGVGLNYRAHAAEAGMDIPTSPITFPFYRTAIIGSGDSIEIPAVSDRIDWEAELAIVIGSGGKNIPLDSAIDHVAGYTIVNDVSARDIQAADGQWSRAKSFDTFKPMGPHITTTDELGDASDLDISLSVNDVTMQDSNTSDLIFSVAEIVNIISQATTLLPGAVISTGTPEGVGMSRNPPQFLQPGDLVTVEIKGIGKLINPVS